MCGEKSSNKSQEGAESRAVAGKETPGKRWEAVPASVRPSPPRQKKKKKNKSSNK